MGDDRIIVPCRRWTLLSVNVVLSGLHRNSVLPSLPFRSASNSWKICSGSRCWCVPCRRVRLKGQKLLGLLHQCGITRSGMAGDDAGNIEPPLISLAVNADSLATWLLPHCVMFWRISLSV